MAQRDDIRVKLTPEGVAEVVRALRQVSKEATDANKQTSGLLNEIKGILPTLGFGAVVTGFAAIVRGAANYADAIDDATQRTGATAENFSVLAYQARFSSVEFGELEQSLIRLTRVVEDARGGSLAQAEAFRELNLSVADFDGLDAAQAYALVAQRLVQVEDGFQRAALAQDVFGRSGGKQLTLLQDLGQKGFAEVAKNARDAGLLISSDLAQASAAANDSLDSMSVLVQGLALQFVAGFAPAVNTALTQFRDDVSGKGTEPVREFGSQTGTVLRVLVAGFTLLGSIAGSALTILGKGLGAAGAQLAALIRGDFGAIKQIGRDFADDFRSELTDAFENVDKNLDKLKASATTKPIEIKVETKLDQRTVDDAGREAEQALQQRLQTLSKQLGEGDIKALTETAKRRRELAEEALKVDQERAQALLALQQNTLAGQRQLADAEAQILAGRTRIVSEGFQAEIALIRQRAEALSNAARRQFGDTRATAQLQTAIARQATAEQLALSQRYYGDLARLQADYLARYRASQEAIKAIDQEVTDNRLQRERTLRDISRSRLTEEQQFNARISDAQEQTAKLRAAVLAGDIENARKLRAEIAALATEIARTQGQGIDSDQAERVGRRLFEDADALLELALAQKRQAEVASKVTAEKGAKSLAQQLTDVESKLKEFTSDQARQIAVGVTVKDDTLRQAIETIAEQLGKNPFAIRVQPQVQGQTVGGFAEGGYVPGSAPHPRADNVIARLTPGEYVHQVAAVRHYGVDFMRDVNTLRFPRFADGGLVGDLASASNDPQHDVVDVNLNVGGRSIRMQSEREQAHALVRALEFVSVGTGR